MKILCLHGRGSNNEIFRMQTAPLQAALEDFEFVFVQGTVRHTEGNWSLYTAEFSKLPLYTYYNPLDPTSILQTHGDLQAIIAKEGPFDGVLGYSGGAALAAELIIGQGRFALDPLFRFAVFINGASPLRVFSLSEVDVSEEKSDPTAALNQARDMFLRPSALRHKEGVSEEDQADHIKLLELLRNFQGNTLVDGTEFLTDGTYGLCRWDTDSSGEPLIDIPTVHVRDVTEDQQDPHHGLHLLGLCRKEIAKEIHHNFRHDFPRGRWLMSRIAESIRETAEACQI